MSTQGSKRITNTTLRNWAIATGVIGIPLGILLFSFIFFSGSATVESYSTNDKCGGRILCYLELNKVCFNNDVFVYPMNPEDIINARPSDQIYDFKLLRKWGEHWREINLNETCKNTACGGKTGITDNAYVYAFRKGKCYDLRIEVRKTVDSTISWQINPEGKWLPLDYYGVTAVEISDYIKEGKYDCSKSCDIEIDKNIVSKQYEIKKIINKDTKIVLYSVDEVLI